MNKLLKGIGKRTAAIVLSLTLIAMAYAPLPVLAETIDGEGGTPYDVTQPGEPGENRRARSTKQPRRKW
jgi:hypothetical protein